MYVWMYLFITRERRGVGAGGGARGGHIERAHACMQVLGGFLFFLLLALRLFSQRSGAVRALASRILSKQAQKTMPMTRANSTGRRRAGATQIRERQRHPTSKLLTWLQKRFEQQLVGPGVVHPASSASRLRLSLAGRAGTGASQPSRSDWTKHKPNTASSTVIVITESSTVNPGHEQPQ